jgi:hypothetical protein
MQSLVPNSRRPDVTFYPYGRIDISSRVAVVLGLQRGDVIDVAEHKGEYLLYVRRRAKDVIGRHEAFVFPSCRGKRYANNFRSYSRKLCQAMYEASQPPSNGGDKKLRLSVGEPVTIENYGTAMPIITRNPL